MTSTEPPSYQAIEAALKKAQNSTAGHKGLDLEAYWLALHLGETIPNWNAIDAKGEVSKLRTISVARQQHAVSSPLSAEFYAEVYPIDLWIVRDLRRRAGRDD